MILQMARRPISDLNQAVATFIAFAGTEKGFIRVIGWFRFIALLFLTARFALGSNYVVPMAIPHALWAYFISIVIFHFLADFYPDYFDSYPSRFIQVVFDLAFITLFYFATGDPKSDVFQLYIFPLLIVSRYAKGFRGLFGFLIAVSLCTAIVWFRFYLISPVDFARPEIWLFRLAPRVSFLALLAIIYTVYQRRRRLSGNLQLVQDDLLKHYQSLDYGVFSVDRQLRISSLNEHLQSRYGFDIIGQPYYQVFCPNSRPPNQCPLTSTIKREVPIANFRTKFTEPIQGAYPVKLSVTPILSKRKNIIGATAVVLDLKEQGMFEEKLQSFAANAEFAIDEANLNYQAQTADETRQLQAITEATAAILSQDQPLGVRKILQRMAELLRCQLSDLRLYQEIEGQARLVLSYTFGYGLEEADEWRFVEVNSSSIVARAYRERRPISALDVQRETGKIKYKQKAVRYGLYSAAAFPMIARGKLLGTVSMYRNRREQFSNEELRLGQAFANSLAATMYNQQLLNKVSAQAALQANQLNALSEFSQGMTVQKDVSTLAKLITDFTRRHLNTEVSSLFLLQEDTLYRKAISGVDEKWFADEIYLVGQGLTGQVVTKKAAVCENNVEANTKVVSENVRRYQQKLLSGEVKHLLAIPLIGQDGLIGVLRVINKLDETGKITDRGFTVYDINLLTIISYSVAVSIQGTRHTEEQAFLLTLARIASSSLIREDVLSHSLNKVTTLLEAEAGAVVLPDQNNQKMIFTVTVGELAEKLRDTSVPISHSIIGKVYQDSKPRLITNVVEAPDFYSAIEKHTGVDFEQLLAVPIIMQEEKFGVLVLINKRQGVFTKHDEELLGSLASWIAIARKNSNLFAQQNKRASALLKLNTRAAEFTATPNYKDTLDKIAWGIKNLLNCDMAGVGIYDHPTGEIRALPDCGTVGIPPELIPKLRFDVNLSGGEVLRSKKVHHTRDAKTDPNSIFGLELTALVDVRAIIAAPLYVGDRDVGILYAGQKKPRDCSKEEEQLFDAYARQASIAIRNTELLNELDRRVATLDSLRKSALYASEKDDLQEVLHIIATAANESLKCDATFIAPFGTKDDKLNIDMSVTVGGNKEFSHSPIIREQGLTQKVFDEPKGLVVIEDFSQYPADFAGNFVQVHQIRSCAAVRLEFKKDIVGVLYVNFLETHHFSEENIKTLKLFATHAAMIIHNFNLMRRNEDIIKERARERLREDIHGVLGSFHSRVMFAAERLGKQMQALGQADLVEALDRLWRSSNSIYRQMERILHDMRDPVLAERGLKVALRELVYSYEDELKIRLQINGDCKFSPDVELALYRIAIECIHNIIKHAEIESRSDEPAFIQLDLASPIPRLIIQDFGKGFDVWQASNAGDGLGLTVIGNWARRIQANCDVQSKVGQGTIVSINVLQKDAIITL